jgi:hypothetical protein
MIATEIAVAMGQTRIPTIRDARRSMDRRFRPAQQASSSIFGASAEPAPQHSAVAAPQHSAVAAPPHRACGELRTVPG